MLSLELNLSRGIQDIQAYRANLGIQAHQEIQDILEPRVNPVILVDLVIRAIQGLLATPAILADREIRVTPEPRENQVTPADQEIRVTLVDLVIRVTRGHPAILGIPEHLAILVTRVDQDGRDGRVTLATPAHLVIQATRDGLVAPVILERQVILGIQERRAILATLA